MLTIDLDGAQVLLSLLNRVRKGNSVTDAEIRSVLAANRFFVDYYCQWTGVTRENLAAAMCRFAQPGWKPATPVLASLSQGFQQAVEEIELLQSKLSFLENVETSALADRVIPHLPLGTPLRSTIHITIDSFNGGFQHQGEMGLSLLMDVTDPDQFETVIAHELHHVGFLYWAERDPIRQAVLGERSGRAIAVRHVQNLLSEGLAIYYCSPLQMQVDEAAGAKMDRYQAKLAKYQREERSLFTQAESVLIRSLEPDADYHACQQAFDAIAIDLDGIEPMGHYIGARMVETMDRFHPHERIVGCIQSLPDFLPLYNQAARKTGAFAYDPTAVERFGRIWEGALH